jgi:hypothetical protein
MRQAVEPLHRLGVRVVEMIQQRQQGSRFQHSRASR